MVTTEILLTVLLGGFGLQFALLLVIWNSLNARMDKIDSRIDKLDEKITDIDRRLCRIEGIMSAKDCCILKDEHIHKEAK